MELTKLEALQQKLFDKKILLKNITNNKLKAACFKLEVKDSNDEDNHFAIFFDKEKLVTRTDEYVAILHETYHIEYNAFYTLDDSLQTRKRREYKANKAMIIDIIPIEQFKKALEYNLELWELAKYFDVTEETILLSFKIYKQMDLLP